MAVSSGTRTGATASDCHRARGLDSPALAFMNCADSQRQRRSMTLWTSRQHRRDSVVPIHGSRLDSTHRRSAAPIERLPIACARFSISRAPRIQTTKVPVAKPLVRKYLPKGEIDRARRDRNCQSGTGQTQREQGNVVEMSGLEPPTSTLRRWICVTSLPGPIEICRLQNVGPYGVKNEPRVNSDIPVRARRAPARFQRLVDRAPCFNLQI